MNRVLRADAIQVSTMIKYQFLTSTMTRHNCKTKAPEPKYNTRTYTH